MISNDTRWLLRSSCSLYLLVWGLDCTNGTLNFLNLMRMDGLHRSAGTESHSGDSAKIPLTSAFTPIFRRTLAMAVEDMGLQYLSQDQVDQVCYAHDVMLSESPDHKRTLPVLSRWVGTSFSAHGVSHTDILHRYLRLSNFLSPEDTDALLTRSRQLLANFSVEDHPLVRITSRHCALLPADRALWDVAVV